MSRPWYYFGCGSEAGHYLFGETRGHVHAPQGVERGLGHFDGVLPPVAHNAFEAPPYVAAYAMLQGLDYSALSWWDRSVDRRPDSNSTVFAPGIRWTASAILEEAPAHFPWVFSRLPQALTLMEWGP